MADRHLLMVFGDAIRSLYDLDQEAWERHMRIVIYDAEDMEPITVVKVPDWVNQYLDEIERGNRGPELIFPVQQPLSMSEVVKELPQEIKNSYVRIRFEPIWKSDGPRSRRRIMWLATTNDGDTALLLRSVFLPGQQGEVNRREQDAFWAGLFHAVGHL